MICEFYITPVHGIMHTYLVIGELCALCVYSRLLRIVVFRTYRMVWIYCSLGSWTRTKMDRGGMRDEEREVGDNY